MYKKLLAFDLETTASDSWATYKEAALDFNRSRITVCSFFDGKNGWTTQDASVMPDAGYITHNGKFDFKTALAHPTNLKLEQYQHDTMLMLVALPHKIEKGWLEGYEAERKVRNKRAGGQIHRVAGGNSLKAAAPYFLGVDAFWEVADHSDTEYAMKDAEYTYRLWEVLTRELKSAGCYDFYADYLMPWSHLLLSMEMSGMHVNTEALDAATVEHAAKAKELEAQLRVLWGREIGAIEASHVAEVSHDYQIKKAMALARLSPSKKKNLELAQIETSERIAKTVARYDDLERKALDKLPPFNIASPSQIKELFLSMGLDIRTFNDEESTGKEVLEALLREGITGIAEFLKWKKSYKLSTAFFPSYNRMQYNGIVHCNFNLNIARTGRLVSSSPNNQQIPKKNMNVYCAPPGELLIYRDASAIEPRLLAYMTECPELCDIFISGSDFHSFNVRMSLGIDEDDATIKREYEAERDLIKEVGLSLIYGAGYRRIQAASAKRGMPLTAKQCKGMHRAFQEKYAVVWEYKAQLEERIKQGEIIRNVLGRPLSFDMDRLHMQSLNTLIQGGASDIVVESARMFQKANPYAKVRLLIHDAIVATAPEDMAQGAYDDMGKIMLSWQLPTQWGDIPLKSEGGVSKVLGGHKGG